MFEVGFVSHPSEFFDADNFTNPGDAVIFWNSSSGKCVGLVAASQCRFVRMTDKPVISETSAVNAGTIPLPQPPKLEIPLCTPASQPGKYDDLAKEFAGAFFQGQVEQGGKRVLLFKSFGDSRSIPVPFETVGNAQLDELVGWLNFELSNRISKAIEWLKNPKNK